MITVADIKRLAPNAHADIIGPIVAAMPATLPLYGITTAKRFTQFIAQAAWECGGFTTMHEGVPRAYASNPAAYFEKMYGYQTPRGRRLGNKVAGDGARRAGRGIFQDTGLYNDAFYGPRIGVDLVNHPEKAAEPIVALKFACEYWRVNGLNALADRGDVTGITKRINGGTNGLAERTALLKKAEAIWSSDASLGLSPAVHAAAVVAVQAQARAPAPVVLVPPVAAPADAPPPEVTAPVLGEEEPAPDVAPTLTPEEAQAVPTAAEVKPMPAPETVPEVPVALDPPPLLRWSKTLWGSFSSGIGGAGTGYSFAQLLDNPNAPWIIGIVLGCASVMVVGLAVVFRERIKKLVEQGI